MSDADIILPDILLHCEPESQYLNTDLQSLLLPLCIAKEWHYIILLRK
jgi:hypothetical protein